MPLSAVRLAAAIRLSLSGTGFWDDTAPGAAAFANAIANAVITEIQTNALVIPTLVAPPGGGPVTGTGVIT